MIKQSIYGPALVFTVLKSPNYKYYQVSVVIDGARQTKWIKEPIA